MKKQHEGAGASGSGESRPMEMSFPVSSPEEQIRREAIWGAAADATGFIVELSDTSDSKVRHLRIVPPREGMDHEPLWRKKEELERDYELGAVTGESDALTHEVDDFLTEHEVQSEDERDRLLMKLHTAIAMNNNPKAREIRAELLRGDKG